MLVGPPSGAADGVLERLDLDENAGGLLVQGNSRISLVQSTAAANTSYGIQGSGSNVRIEINECRILNNGTGILVQNIDPSNPMIYLANSSVSFNATGVDFTLLANTGSVVTPQPENLSSSPNVILTNSFVGNGTDFDHGQIGSYVRR